MKYFNNYPYTAESLKAEFRALCLTMHPDKGGNADEFKAMSAEYYDLLKNVDGTTAREAEEARQRAEEARREREEREREAREYEARERARREREEAEERERIRKAQEVSRAAVRAWAGILERIPEAVTGKKRAYDFADDKSRAAYVAATKRNIKAVINHYFPGLKVTVSISGRIWREDFTISWQDGPSIKELRETCKELAYFVPTSYHSDPYADYGDYRERKESAPWREAYGQALGDVTEIEYTRGLSDEGKQQAEEMAARYFANFDPKSDADTFAANLEEFGNLAKAAGFDGENLTNIFRTITGQYYADLCGCWSEITGEVNRRELRKVLAEHVRVNVTPKEKAPEFVPTYGPTYKAIKKAMGANVFYIDAKESRKNAEQEITIFAAAERLASGEAVQIGHKWNYDGETLISGTDRGGYKTQQKRAAKFEAVGIILEGVSFNTYGHINAIDIKAETLEALRREFADIERQRKEWEAKQTGTQQTADTAEASATADTADKGTDEADKGTTANEPTNTTSESREAVTANESKPQATATESADTATNGDGLRMEKYSEKATVIRGYNAEQAAELEAMGGKEWRNLKGGKGYIFSTRRHGEKLAEWFKAQTEPATGTPLDDPQDITDTATTSAPADDQPTATASEAAREVSPLLEAVADLLQTIGNALQEAARYEGVTIPAATLERWKQEAENGTKTAAARLAEVCACLASLTPDSRRDFDALGAIFWSLAEQMRTAADRADLLNGYEFARAQLFDLIDRTQTENQARAVREANEASEADRRAA